MYKWTFCESILKNFVSDDKKVIKLEIVKIAFVIISRRLSKAETIIKHTISERFFVPSVDEWMAINDEEKDTFDEFDETFQAWGIHSENENSMKIRTQELLTKLEEN